MHLKKLIFLLLTLTMLISACSQPEQKTFTNPILMGYYPDPSICKVDSGYYLVNSSFAHFPAIPIHFSKDLVNWKQVGSVFTSVDQLDLNGFGVSRAIFAPSIRYRNGLFYVTCTVVDGGGNFVTTAKDPAGPWTDPVYLPEINGIDPSPFFDYDGKAYIVYNSDAPDYKPEYEGHRTIRINEFDPVNLKVISDNKILVNGGWDFSTKPIWIEGPHIYKIKGTYYLCAAEGGTSTNHSQVIFRSDSVMGPYEPYQGNPIMTHRDLDPARPNAITCVGHADLVQNENGDWWAVFLGCRPYEPVAEGYYNTGRETFLAPVKWVAGWPLIDPAHEEIQYHYPYPNKPAPFADADPTSGNFTIRDDFDKTELKKNYLFLRSPLEQWWSLTERPGSLSMKVRPETCADKTNPSFIAHRQQHLKGSIAVGLDFNAARKNEKAGLVAFQNENHYYLLCKSIKDGAPVVQLFKSNPDADESLELLSEAALNNEANEASLNLKIAADGNTYSFFYSRNDSSWTPLKQGVDATFLSTRTAGGFVGVVYGMYATSLHQSSSDTAYFDWLEYIGDDDIYK